MPKYFKNIVYLILFSLVLLSCNKLETYDDRPIITDSSFELLKNSIGQDTSLLVKFTYTDGNGDVGLTDADSIAPYNANVMIDYYEKIDGEFTKILIPGTTDTLNFNSRIKKFGSNNPTKAEVKVKVDISILLADTVRFDVYILDKQLNRSNTVKIGPIALTN